MVGMSEWVWALFGVALAAFAVWLGVRIINRRERWAEWIALVLVLVIGIYPMSWGWLSGY